VVRLDQPSQQLRRALRLFFQPLQLHLEPADLLEQLGLFGIGLSGAGRPKGPQRAARAVPEHVERALEVPWLGGGAPSPCAGADSPSPFICPAVNTYGNSFRGTLLNLDGTGWLALGPEGHYGCSAGAENRFAFKVRELNNRVREYTPDDFRKASGWKNDPERVKLSGK
jgi:hypothetical protein